MAQQGLLKFKPFVLLGIVFISITGGGTLVWTAFLLYYLKAPKDLTMTLIATVIPIGVIAGLAILLFVIKLLKSIIKPFLSATNRVAERDLTQKLYFPSKDIFGQMSQAFNKMVGDVRETIMQTADTADEVADEANKVSVAVESTTAAIEQISAAIEQIASGTQRQAEQLVETFQTVQELSAGVQQIAANSQAAFASSKNAASSAIKGAQQVGNAVEKISAIATTVGDSTKAVHQLNERSEHIGEIVNVITGIADQTNLLALNAAIEAARAGEHGRGFAVVADEVRKLAEGSGTAAQKIGDLIKEIQSQTATVTGAMGVVGREVEEGVKIASSAQVALEDIVSAVEVTDQMIQEISIAAQQQSEGIAQVVTAVDTVSGIAQQSSVATQQVSASIQQQMGANEQISVLSASLASLAGDLKQRIKSFQTK